ncbi:MAG: hypothetical protein NC117_05235 [Pseudoflavonifractor sp.]|nr:hypothetical protein [Pseudoflavonifractor sp.]
MKKLYLFIVCLMTAAIGAYAQTGQKYYLDIAQNNERYYFEWDATLQCYVLDMPQLWGNFKVYDDRYVNGSNDQNQYIFGASTDNNGFGVTPDSEKKLANPGNDMSIQGGGQLYNVKLEFWPNTMELKIVGGSYDPPTPTTPTITIKATKSEATTPEDGVIDFEIGTSMIDNPTSLDYDVYVIWQPAGATGYDYLETRLNGTLTGSFDVDRLTIDSTNNFWLVVKTTYNDADLISHSETTITTPAIPLLIGQLAQGEWKPNVVVEGQTFARLRECYYYTVTLVGKGEFSFVSKAGTSDTDWATVNAHPRYAPSENRVVAPLMVWIPYTRFTGSTTNAWTPADFEPNTTYTIQFSFPKKEVAVIHAATPTEIEGVAADVDNGPVDVFNIQGVMVRHDVAREDATAGLPAGFYIVGHEKVFVH